MGADNRHRKGSAVKMKLMDSYSRKCKLKMLESILLTSNVIKTFIYNWFYLYSFLIII